MRFRLFKLSRASPAAGIGPRHAWLARARRSLQRQGIHRQWHAERERRRRRGRRRRRAAAARRESGSEAARAAVTLARAAAAGAPSGGSAGETSSAGSAGKPPVGCDCVAGEYCQDGTNKCRKCTDFSRLEFGAAAKADHARAERRKHRTLCAPAGHGLGAVLRLGRPGQIQDLVHAPPPSAASARR